MLGNSQKMVVIPPTNNQSPQSQIIDEQKVSIGSSGRIMEKPGQELLQQQQQSLKCPRCDSSNTKFCYYNNYSLSQPRHFCKACKRYWTRGGTLRNVPVGGGCRKNKRVKRPTSSAIDTSSSAPIPSANSSLPSQPQIDINPLFYGLTSNSCDMTLPFARFNSRVSRVETVSGYDLQPQLNALGLGFSSGIMSSEAGDNGYPNGYTSNNSLLSSYSSIFGRSSSTSASNSPIMTSLLQQQKFINGGAKDGPGTNSTFQGLAPLEELQIAGNNGSSEAEMAALKEVKVEERQKRLEWNSIGAYQNQIEHGGGLSDYTPYYWNAAAATSTAMGAWNDQTNNVGPSVTSLI